MSFIKKLFLPRIPDELIPNIYQSITNGTDMTYDGPNIRLKEEFGSYYGWYKPSDDVQQWFSTNITPEIYFGIQVIKERMPIHRDFGPTPESMTELKFNYILDTGGDNVVTNYYDKDKNLIQSYILEPHIWYILNVRELHNVDNIELGRSRISITGRLLPG
jgi:hypothetical protein